MNRREYLKKTLGGAALLGAAGILNPAEAASELFSISMTDNLGRYTLPDLPYAHDALEPYIDAQTMQLHHERHHQAYVNGLNTALDKLEESRNSNDFSLVKHWSREISFHGGGHYLHTLFWSVMAPNSGGDPKNAALKAQIERSFGTYDGFRRHFIAASNAVEGSGWGVLAWEPVGKRLIIHQIERQSDLSTWSNIPLLMVDVWEHAYYLKYQNRRGDYTNAFMNVVNWDEVARRLDAAMKF